MASTNTTAKAADKAEQEPTVAPAGDHDRVTMLSLRADGSPDQTAPEIVGDKAVAEAATKRQFAERAVSAADDAARRANQEADKAPQDPTISALQEEHEKVAAAAESTAAAVVEQLHQG